MAARMTYYAHLIGPPVSATNGTLSLWVHNDDENPLAIPSALITITPGTFQKYTNLAGSATFNLLILNQTYNVTVSKPDTIR
jgi:hypothetical protein